MSDASIESEYSQKRTLLAMTANGANSELATFEFSSLEAKKVIGSPAALDLGIFTQRLTVLNEAEETISHASGFLVEGQGYDYLYTCWHVVTGFDFFAPKVSDPPKPRFLKIEGLGTRNEEFGSSLGDLITGKIALYLPDGQPRWEQEPLPQHRPHADLNSVGVYVPSSLDVVRIPLELPESLHPVRIPATKAAVPFLLPLQDLILTGYPYGFSSLDDTPWPILLKRSVAGSFPNGTDTLLDAPGSPGMSGGPVWTTDFMLAGIYRGSRFPDYQAGMRQHHSNDKHAALGIVTVANRFIDQAHNGNSSGPRCLELAR